MDFYEIISIISIIFLGIIVLFTISKSVSVFREENEEEKL